MRGYYNYIFTTISSMRDAGFYRIGDPSEQMGSFSSIFQYVAPINPGYTNGLNVFGVANGAKTNLIEAAVRYNFSDSQKWYQFRKLGDERKIRIEKTLGRVGSKYLKMSKNVGRSSVSYFYSYRNYELRDLYNN